MSPSVISEQIRMRWREDKRCLFASFFLFLARLGFGIYVLTMPLGITFREVFGGLATAGVVAYYLTDWRGSNMSRIGVKWLFLALLILVLAKSVFTIHPSLSFYAIHHSLHKGLMLFPAGVEFIRRPRDLALVVWLFLASSLYQGLDGIYQAVTGFDFFTGEAIWKGRLTGVLGGNGRVGNLISLLLPVALALPAVLRRPRSLVGRLLLSALLLAPGLFLLYGAGARSGIIGFAAALAVFAWLRFGPKVILPGIALAAVALLLGPQNLTLHKIMQDPRWEIWDAAIEVFKHHPLFGSGVNTFNAAFKELSIVFERSAQDLPHPHNVYLQFLADTGLVGFAIFVSFLLGSLGWAALMVRRAVRAMPGGWTTAASGLVASGAGYAVTAFSAHNFYRTWWLGMAMALLGATMAAACVCREAMRDGGKSGEGRA